MSLLNDMLRDMEKSRPQARQDENLFAIGGVDGEFQDEKQIGINRVRWTLVFVVLLVHFLFYIYIVAGSNSVSSFKSDPVSLVPVMGNKINEQMSIFESAAPRRLDFFSFQEKTAESLTNFGRIVFRVIEPVVEEAYAVSRLELLPKASAGSRKMNNTSAEIGTQKNSAISDNAHLLQIEKSTASRERGAVSLAREHLAKGKPLLAEKVLLKEVEENTSALLSVIELADLYFSTNNVAGLSLLVGSQLYSEDSLRAYVLARYYVLVGDKDLALSLLLNERPVSHIEEKYLSVQAALFQQTGKTEEAEQLYKTLLLTNKNSFSLWLGYAMACEANKKTACAVKSYQQVLSFRALNTEVSVWVKGRVKALNSGFPGSEMTNS